MTDVFADTFYWIALTNTSDAAHQKAVSFDLSRGARGIVTTDEVLNEFLTYFAGRGPLLRLKAVAVTHGILDDPTILVLSQSRETFLAGLKLYSDRADKGYSLTDCVSMTTMAREGLLDVLSNDRHFEQEGYTRLL